MHMRDDTIESLQQPEDNAQGSMNLNQPQAPRDKSR